MNLIVFGLPEAKADNGQAQEWNTQEMVDKDIELMNKLIEEELGVGLSPRTGIINARRLGSFKKNNTKPRPLKLEFKDLNAKRDVLTNAKKFRKSSVEAAKNIFINPDLTEKQRESDKKLRETMWQQRNSGKNVIIKRGKIVEADHEVRKFRSVPKSDNPTQNSEKLNPDQNTTTPKDD